MSSIDKFGKKGKKRVTNLFIKTLSFHIILTNHNIIPKVRNTSYGTHLNKAAQDSLASKHHFHFTPQNPSS
jgi:hypothetical protein